MSDQDSTIGAAGANEGEVDPGVGLDDSGASSGAGAGTGSGAGSSTGARTGGLVQPAADIDTGGGPDIGGGGATGGASQMDELASMGGNDATVAYTDSDTDDPDESGASAEQDIIGDDTSS